ncbi:MAG: hypothetical protein K9K84_11440 [Methylovulum sp.]|nr:hypothetical protein [Methylovulum sp.]
MASYFFFTNWLSDQSQKILVRCRSVCFFLIKGHKLKKLGRFTKIRGANWIKFGEGVCIGDFCWIEAVYKYQHKKYQPNLTIGDNVAISDLSHISCADSIFIGADCLIGSKVYIGDHNHGSLSNLNELLVTPPALRHLSDLMPISIGEKCWICDGVVILAGTQLAAGSVVGANSVVKIKSDRPALIAGIPAKIIKYLD